MGNPEINIPVVSLACHLLLLGGMWGCSNYKKIYSCETRGRGTKAIDRPQFAMWLGMGFDHIHACSFFFFFFFSAELPRLRNTDYLYFHILYFSIQKNLLCYAMLVLSTWLYNIFTRATIHTNQSLNSSFALSH